MLRAMTSAACRSRGTRHLGRFSEKGHSLPWTEVFAAGRHRGKTYTLLTRHFIRDLSGVPLSGRIEQILNRDAVPIRKRRANLPKELAVVIHRGLEREPERRYPGVSDFRQALRPFAT